MIKMEHIYLLTKHTTSIEEHPISRNHDFVPHPSVAQMKKMLLQLLFVLATLAMFPYTAASAIIPLL